MRAREYAEALGARVTALLELADTGAMDRPMMMARAAFSAAETPELELDPQPQTVQAARAGPVHDQRAGAGLMTPARVLPSTNWWHGPGRWPPPVRGSCSASPGHPGRASPPSPSGSSPSSARSARLVPMDGFHLAQAELVRLGRADRKGAADTFDANGYVALLRRLHRLEPSTVYAPTFRRDLEEPVAGAIEVPPSVRLVVTEGNYLLLPQAPWEEVRSLLHEVWFLDLDAELRRTRLTARHEAFGRTPAAARAWALGSDERNAALIAPTADRADLVVRLAGAV